MLRSIRNDLNSYSLSNLSLLAKYFGIDPIDILSQKIAPLILAQQKFKQKAFMLSEESDEPIPEASDCSNDVDYITQEKWSSKPEIKIHILDPNNLDAKPYT